jgi:hypothetical protein
MATKTVRLFSFHARPPTAGPRDTIFASPSYPTYLQPCVFRRSHQDSEAPNSLRLLRSRRHRPRRRTADKRDELAPLH